MDGRQTEKFNSVGVSEYAYSFGIDLCHHWRHFWWAENRMFEPSSFELALEFTTFSFPHGQQIASCLRRFIAVALSSS
jgi:hypothetical protein